MKCVRFGSDYGGWPVIVDDLNRDSIVYSCGIEEDNSFGLSLINRYGMNVYAFDPTPNTARWIARQELPKQYIYFPIGIDGVDGRKRLYPISGGPESFSEIEIPGTEDRVIEVEMRRLGTIMDILGHKSVDILKMDIEGSEYGVLKEIVEKGLDVKQIIVEFHSGVWNKYTEEDDQNAITELERIGYRCFYNKGGEYSFILKGEIEKVFHDHEIEKFEVGK